MSRHANLYVRTDCPINTLIDQLILTAPWRNRGVRLTPHSAKLSGMADSPKGMENLESGHIRWLKSHKI